MSVESTVNGYLTGHAALTALVGSRIYPEAAALDSPLPYVVFSKLEGEEYNNLLGERLLGRYRFSVQAWHRVKDSAETTLNECIEALRVNGVPIETRTASFDEEVGLHGAIAEFDYWG